MDCEIWKDMVDFEGLYQVSNLGNVKKINSNKNKAKLVSNKGYLYVMLSKNGKAYARTIHRLVAQAFIPNPFGKKEINHIDGNKHNNCVSNLEWNTRIENVRHSIVNGLFVPKPTPQALLAMHDTTKKRIAQIKNGRIIKIYESCNDAGRKTHISSGNISMCANGKKESANGYQWEYI